MEIFQIIVKLVIRNEDNMAVTVRKAKLEDRIAIYEWFNDLYTQAMFEKQTKVSKEVHIKWFDTILNSDSELLLIPYSQALRLGVIRFSKKNNCWEMSLYIKITYMTQNLCSEVIKSAINFLKNETDIKNILISIDQGNEIITQVLNKADFKLIENNDLLIFKRDIE